MVATLNFNRPKSAQTNVTGIDFTVKAAEKPNAPAAVTAGSTGELDARIQADADESGGSDVQDIFKVEAKPELDATGIMKLKVTVTPIKGDATEGTPQITTVEHPQNMDAWQSAAGRARQA